MTPSNWNKDKAIDYTHEREWRVPHDLEFELSHVEFLIVAQYEDMAKAPATLKNAISALSDPAEDLAESLFALDQAATTPPHPGWSRAQGRSTDAYNC